MLRKSTTAFVFCSGLFCISFCTELMEEHSSLKKLSSLMLGIYCLSYTAPFFWDPHDFGNLFTCHSFPLIRFFCLDLLKSSECYCERKKKRQVFKDYNNSFPGSTNPMIFTHIKNKNNNQKPKTKPIFFSFRKRKTKTTYTKTWTFFLHPYHALLVIPLPPFPFLHCHTRKHCLLLTMSLVKARISDLKWVASFVWGSLLPFGQSTRLWSIPTKPPYK